MRQGAADFKRPTHRRLSRGFWEALGGFLFILFMFLFGHERQPSADVFHHEEDEITRRSVTVGMNFTEEMISANSFTR